MTIDLDYRLGLADLRSLVTFPPTLLAEACTSSPASLAGREGYTAH